MKFYIASCCDDGGIYLCEYSGGTARIIEKTPMESPMYMAYNDGKMYVLLLKSFEDGFSGLATFDVKSEKLIKSCDIASTNGIVACHLCVLDNNVYCVNYLSGNVTKINEKTVTHTGKGVHPTRQKMAHTHYINSFDNEYLLCCDLGTDEIYTYDKALNEVSRVSVPKGHGARHLAYKNGYVFCANELEATVSTFKYSDGILSLVDTVSTFPDGKNPEGNTAAAIRVKDGYLYVSNRGHDSIAVFKEKCGKLTLVANVDCGGSSPRDFDIFGDLLICTNEKSDTVTFFEIKDGIPVRTDAVLDISAPLCVIQGGEN